MLRLGWNGSLPIMIYHDCNDRSVSFNSNEWRWDIITCNHLYWNYINYHDCVAPWSLNWQWSIMIDYCHNYDHYIYTKSENSQLSGFQISRKHAVWRHFSKPTFLLLFYSCLSGNLFTRSGATFQVPFNEDTM